jgi:N-acetylmuramoyl-L-alanine amidase
MINIVNDISGYLLKHPSKTYSFRDTNTIDKIVIHQTDTEDQGKFSAYAIASFHVNTNNWPGIGYHYIITEDGNIYKTSSEDLITYHASNYNNRSIGVAITGLHRCSADDDNFEVISKKKYKALIFLLAKLSNEFNINTDNIIGHTETGSPKSCPNLNMDQLRSDVKKKRYSYGAERLFSLCA